MSKVVHYKEFQHKCNRPHDFHFTEGHQEYLVAHSADVQGNVVADHGVNHEKGHHQGKDYILKLCFWRGCKKSCVFGK